MKLIILYGPPASGKYTIANLLAEKTGYRFFHNHLTVDLLKSVFDWGTPEFFRLSKKIRLEIFEEAAKQNIPGIVNTFVYQKCDDDDFVKDVITSVEKHGGEVKFIQIYCAQDELLKRVTEDSRKQFKKVHNPDDLLKSLNKDDLMSSIDFVDNIRIDSTHLSAQETFEKIYEATR